MDPRRVLTFRAVAHRALVLGRRAELRSSQPSVSNQVAALEREIGARLLERRPGGLRLTRAGEILLEHADAIAVRFELARASSPRSPTTSARGCASAPSRPLWRGWCPAAIARLRLAHPETQGDRRRGRADELAARVRSGELHLAVAFQDAAEPRDEPRGLERRDLLRERFMVALAPDHRLAGQAGCASPTSPTTTGPPP